MNMVNALTSLIEVMKMVFTRSKDNNNINNLNKILMYFHIVVMTRKKHIY